jgi:hypothetical protein
MLVFPASITSNMPASKVKAEESSYFFEKK